MNAMGDDLFKDDLNGKRPPWKMTTMEGDHNEIQPQMKTTSNEDDLNGRRTQWNTTSRMPYRRQMTSACLASQFHTELGTAQPQLVLSFYWKFCELSELFLTQS